MTATRDVGAAASRTLGGTLAIVLAALLAGCATFVAPPSGPAPAPERALAAWARVLDRFVDAEGRVAFARLAADRADLDTMVAFVAATPFEAVAPGTPRLAHHINAYNALSMWNVIESGLPETHAGFAKLRFFVLRRFMIGGRAISLYGYENDVIRPLGEPRVHFALNCSARSCPVLPRLPFSASALETQLEDETRRFFARRENLRVDHAERTVWLSEIMRFYEADFVSAAAPGLLDYVARYAGDPLPRDYRVRFVPYDWTVAHAPDQGTMRSTGPSNR